LLWALEKNNTDLAIALVYSGADLTIKDTVSLLLSSNIFIYTVLCMYVVWYDATN
jgi:hypothetical protein